MKAVVPYFDEEFVVHDIKVIEGQNGLFIAMPSRKMGEGDFRDIAHPLRSETRNRIKEAIFAEYEKILENASAPPSVTPVHEESAENDEEEADDDGVNKDEEAVEEDNDEEEKQE